MSFNSSMFSLLASQLEKSYCSCGHKSRTFISVNLPNSVVCIGVSLFIRIDNNYLSQFYPVLLDAHFAAFMGPVTFAGIIVIGVAVFAGAAIANHLLTAAVK